MWPGAHAHCQEVLQLPPDGSPCICLLAYHLQLDQNAAAHLVFILCFLFTVLVPCCSSHFFKLTAPSYCQEMVKSSSPTQPLHSSAFWWLAAPSLWEWCGLTLFPMKSECTLCKSVWTKASATHQQRIYQNPHPLFSMDPCTHAASACPLSLSLYVLGLVRLAFLLQSKMCGSTVAHLVYWFNWEFHSYLSLILADNVHGYFQYCSATVLYLFRSILWTWRLKICLKSQLYTS